MNVGIACFSARFVWPGLLPAGHTLSKGGVGADGLIRASSIFPTVNAVRVDYCATSAAAASYISQ
jgi:hypothetical protein